MIKAGDYLIKVRSVDGNEVAVPVGAPTNGDYCIQAVTSDGKKVALALDPMKKTGEVGVIATTADGHRVGLTFGKMEELPVLWTLAQTGPVSSMVVAWSKNLSQVFSIALPADNYGLREVSSNGSVLLRSGSRFITQYNATGAFVRTYSDTGLVTSNIVTGGTGKWHWATNALRRWTPGNASLDWTLGGSWFLVRVSSTGYCVGENSGFNTTLVGVNPSGAQVWYQTSLPAVVCQTGDNNLLMLPSYSTGYLKSMETGANGDVRAIDFNYSRYAPNFNGCLAFARVTNPASNKVYVGLMNNLLENTEEHELELAGPSIQLIDSLAYHSVHGWFFRMISGSDYSIVHANADGEFVARTSVSSSTLSLTCALE